MKFRMGIAAMLLLTAVMLKSISAAFSLINMPSDVTVLLGCVVLGITIIFGPWLYILIYKASMKKSITTTTENTDEA